MSEGEQRIGKFSRAYTAIAPVLISSLTTAAMVTGDGILARAELDRHYGLMVARVIEATLALLLLGGIAVAIAQGRRRARAFGRARVLVVALAGVGYAAGALVASALFARSENLRLLRGGLDMEVVLMSSPALLVAIVGSALCGLSSVIASIACWFLIPRPLRIRIWIGADSIASAGFVWAVLRLPTQPPAGEPNALALPLLRHVITAVFLLRLLVRVMPLLLDGIESAGFQTLVAARHLRSKKSGFLATISILSVLAVGVSCMALTTTLSVMGGFRNDLKRKILGNNPHVVIDRETGRIEDWRPMLDSVEQTRGIAGAAPFVSGEVMLSSASNLATAVLRGIDPQRIGKVNDLPRNLTSGKLSYLDHPEKLLEAPPPDDFRAGALLFGHDKRGARHALHADAGVDEDAVREHDAGAIVAENAADAGAVAGATASTTRGASDKSAQKKLDLEKRIQSLEAFLRDAGDTRTKPEDRELLPGIIIGQELARSLRLYVGDEVNVVAPLGALGPQGPMPKSRPFRVAGIFYSGMYEYDMKSVYVALETAQKFLNTGDSVSGIEIRVHEIERAPEIAAGIRGLLAGDGVRVRDWQELNSRLFGALALEKLAMFVALGIAILVASFCIAGTLTLMVQEKGREVAILKAMGTSDRAVVGVFVIEGGLIGVLGAALGLFFGYMLCFAAEHFGIRMNPEVYYIDRLPVHIDPTEFSLTGLAAIAVCLVITIYPALLASRLRPVDALRYE